MRGANYYLAWLAFWVLIVFINREDIKKAFTQDARGINLFVRVWFCVIILLAISDLVGLVNTLYNDGSGGFPLY